MATVATIQRRVYRGRIKCQGCGQAVKEINQTSIGKLLIFEQSEDTVPRAFECTRCEAIILETELIEGKFIPPQLRK